MGLDGWGQSALVRDVPPTPNLEVTSEAKASSQNFGCNWLSEQNAPETRWITGRRFMLYGNSLRRH